MTTFLKDDLISLESASCDMEKKIIELEMVKERASADIKRHKSVVLKISEDIKSWIDGRAKQMIDTADSQEAEISSKVSDCIEKIQSDLETLRGFMTRFHHLPERDNSDVANLTPNYEEIHLRASELLEHQLDGDMKDCYSLKVDLPRPKDIYDQLQKAGSSCCQGLHSLLLKIYN